MADVLEELAALLNETVASSEQNRLMVQNALMHGHVTFKENGALPEDLIVKTHESGKPIRVSVLGMLNTALSRAGSEQRFVAVCDDGGEDEFAKGVLLRFEVRPSRGIEVEG